MGKMGLAIAENLEGPYIQLPFPVTGNDRTIEDGYAFVVNGKICLLTTDNHGIIEEGGGILWTSVDGMNFTIQDKGFGRIGQYINIDRDKVKVHYGDPGIIKFERPQVLMMNGRPAYLYAASGSNIYGGDCTVSYVLKYAG